MISSLSLEYYGKMRTTKTIDYLCTVEKAYVLSDIQAQVCARLEGSCNKKDGFCVEVKQVIVTELRASFRGSLITRSSVIADFFLPQEGEIVNVFIERCIPGKGIVCKFMDMNILVPQRTIQGEYPQEKKVVVKLEKVRYQLGKYNSIGILLKG